MAFQERAQGLCSQLHLTAVRRPVFIGVAVLLVLVLAVTAPFFAFPSASSVEVHAAGRDGGDASEAFGDVLPEESVAGTETETASSGEAGGGGTAAPVADTALPAAAQESKLCIHVDGSVAVPGVYYLDTGSRVIDAVEAAGGLTEGALTEAVNLAQGLQDGQQVVIPDATTAAPVAGAASDQSAMLGDAPSSGLVNINTADAATLTTLNGVGEATAEKIIADREANGPFKTLEDLKRVSGIGDKKFEALRDFICL